MLPMAEVVKVEETRDGGKKDKDEEDTAICVQPPILPPPPFPAEGRRSSAMHGMRIECSEDATWSRVVYYFNTAGPEYQQHMTYWWVDIDGPKRPKEVKVEMDKRLGVIIASGNMRPLTLTKALSGCRPLRAYAEAAANWFGKGLLDQKNWCKSGNGNECFYRVPHKTVDLNDTEKPLVERYIREDFAEEYPGKRLTFYYSPGTLKLVELVINDYPVEQCHQAPPVKSCSGCIIS